MVSLLVRPLVCPEVPGISPKGDQKFAFVPGSMVSNLDFVESIFGNAGDPFLAENDAGLDVDHWTGHTGCVVLAPHLTHLKRKTWDCPTLMRLRRVKRRRMCWFPQMNSTTKGARLRLPVGIWMG